MQRTVQTPDGRVLAVEEAGDPAGRPVLVHNGTPNSRHLYGPDTRDAAERGLRLIPCVVRDPDVSPGRSINMLYGSIL